MAVNDRELWRLGCAAVAQEYVALPQPVRVRVNTLARRVRETKEELARIVSQVGGSAICASCRGECCATGKNHVTVVDLLVHFSEGRAVPEPDFGRKSCPFLGERGCVMAPSYRPFNCIIFNCDRIEEGLEAPARAELYRVERELRELCREFDLFLGNRFGAGLLIVSERCLLRQRLPLFRTTTTDGESLHGNDQRSGTGTYR